MVLCMKVNGLMIYNMEMELRHGPMAHATEVPIIKARNRESDAINGMMDQSILANGIKIRYLE